MLDSLWSRTKNEDRGGKESLYVTFTFLFDRCIPNCYIFEVRKSRNMKDTASQVFTQLTNQLYNLCLY